MYATCMSGILTKVLLTEFCGIYKFRSGTETEDDKIHIGIATCNITLFSERN